MAITTGIATVASVEIVVEFRSIQFWWSFAAIPALFAVPTGLPLLGAAAAADLRAGSADLGAGSADLGAGSADPFARGSTLVDDVLVERGCDRGERWLERRLAESSATGHHSLEVSPRMAG